MHITPHIETWQRVTLVYRNANTLGVVTGGTPERVRVRVGAHPVTGKPVTVTRNATQLAAAAPLIAKK